MKKILSLSLCLVLMLALLVPAYADVTPKGEFPIVDAPCTLTVAVPVSSKVEDIRTNRLTLWMEETSGVTLEFVELSDSDTATQINMMMNSGTLPDIILGYDFPYDVLCSYADAGLILPIEEYIEAYGINVYDVIVADLGPATMGYVSYDGHIWAMPSGGQLITNKYSHYPARIQGQFLEALGMEMPRTLDEFYDYLVAVRDNDVNGNGDPSDEIPMIGYASSGYEACIYRFLFSAFQYTDTNTFLKVNEDGKVEFIANNELFKEAIAYLKKLVDEKLLDPASFTQDASVVASRVAPEGSQVGCYATGYSSDVHDTTSEEYMNLIFTPNMEGPYGYKSTMVEPQNVKRSMVVTSACKNPDVAVRFFPTKRPSPSASALKGNSGKWRKKACWAVTGPRPGSR